jgi:hypothetical protein
MRHFYTLCLLSCLLVASAFAEEESAQSVDSFSFSGYANVTVDAPAGGKIALGIDDLSLFASGQINQGLNPFIEAEIGGLTLVQQGANQAKAHLMLERMYNDSYLSNKLTLRLGKMLSPVGEWNLIHAAPLVMTMTRPMVTYHGFSEYASGASLLYSGTKGALPDVQLYVQPGNEIHPRTPDVVVRAYEQVSGLHLNWPMALNDKLGFSVQRAKVKNTGEQQTLTGFNFNKEFGNLSIDSETIYTDISGANPLRERDNEWGSYLQGAYTLSEGWNLIGRYEYFASRMRRSASENALLGLAYKSESHAVWKFEYVRSYGQELDIQTGLYASYSKLF